MSYPCKSRPAPRYINMPPVDKSDPAEGKMNLVGVRDIRTKMPANEAPTIEVEFVCKFFPLAPECYRLMSEALLAVGLACGDAEKFEVEAREMVKKMMFTQVNICQLEDAVDLHFSMVEEADAK